MTALQRAEQQAVMKAEQAEARKRQNTLSLQRSAPHEKEERKKPLPSLKKTLDDDDDLGAFEEEGA